MIKLDKTKYKQRNKNTIKKMGKEWENIFMEPKKDVRKKKQLIILGNGFDLTCGLKSKFTDFYNSIDSSKIRTNLLYYMADYVKRYEDEGNKLEKWADVEGLLKAILVELNAVVKSGEIRSEFAEQLISFIEYKSEINNTSDGWTKSKYRQENQSAYFDFLKEEVSQFENEFSDYLQLTEAENETYDIKKERLAVLLSLIEVEPDLFRTPHNMTEQEHINRCMDVIETREYAANFLSFNYTDVSLKAEPHQTQNIHGSLEKQDIILGVDGHNSPDEFLEFTKTYRLLSHTTEPEAINFSEEIDYIKIMGHSLGEADYSYFQAIFDGIGLYNSKTKLFFYYQVYDENQRHEIIREHYHSVTKLLKTYGATFSSNPDHGKNLIHKLILEKRLVIKEIDCSMLNYPILS